jgi:acyl-CoA thioester hydrolase
MEREDGIFLAVAEAGCRYRSPARFDDEVIIKTWIEEASTRIVIFHYEMRVAEDDRLLATGHTRHVFVNRDMHRAQLPGKYHPMFGL